MGKNKAETAAQLTVGTIMWAVASYGTGWGPFGHKFSEGTYNYIETDNNGVPVKVVNHQGKNWGRDQDTFFTLDSAAIKTFQDLNEEAVKTRELGTLPAAHAEKKYQREIDKYVAAETAKYKK